MSTQPNDRINMNDIAILYLKKGLFTTSKRNKSIPQVNEYLFIIFILLQLTNSFHFCKLTCKSESNECENAPDKIECYNIGSKRNYTEVQAILFLIFKMNSFYQLKFFVLVGMQSSIA